MAKSLFFVAVVTLLVAASVHAEIVWPDPSFEVSDEAAAAGVKRSDDVQEVYDYPEENENDPQALVDLDMGTFIVDGLTELAVSNCPQFRVDNVGGVFHLIYVSPLDYENAGNPVSVCTLTHQEGTETMYLTLFNVNERPPVFDDAPLEPVSIDENVEGVTDLLTVPTSDPDGQDNEFDNSISYSIANTFGDRFGITAGGVVQVLLPLDHETSIEYRLTLQIEDVADALGDSLTSETQLIVSVTDVPDEPPTFISYVGIQELEENTLLGGNEFFSIQAEDGDFNNPVTPTYSVIDINDGTSSLAPEDYFLDVSADGVVTLTQEVDRDVMGDNNIYRVTFEASEPNNGCSSHPCADTLEVTIRVQDVDDNLPELTVPTKVIEVPENYLDTLDLGTITVADADKELQFNTFDVVARQTEGGADFDPAAIIITPSSGIGEATISLRANSALEFFNREQRPTVEFTLAAVDRYDTDRETAENIVITLTDVNDVTPSFVDFEASYTFLEDLSDATYIEDLDMYELFTVQAEDGDISPEFGNDSIIYSISTDAPLIIDEDTGTVYAPAGAFDFENKDEHTVKITATDSRDSPQFSLLKTETTTITVGNVNDETPRISSDSGSSQICLYENGVDDWPPEKCDTGAPSSLGLLEVTLTATDEDPDSNLAIAIDWDQSQAFKSYFPVDPAVYDYQLLDLDPVQNDEDGSVTAKFTLRDGQYLDREYVDNIVLYLTATDTAQTDGNNVDNIQLNLIISDLDDTAPVLDNFDDLDFTINETPRDEEAGFEETILTQFKIVITDQDEPPHAFDVQLTPINLPTAYLEPYPRDEDPSVPEIMLVQKLPIDREASDIDGVDGVLTYSLVVTDAAGNPVEKTIELKVDDLNDMEPVFVDPVNETSIEEHPDNGEEVLQMEAYDPDASGVPVTYSLFSQGVPFSINPTTGLLVVDQVAGIEIDYERETSYDIIVSASDGLLPTTFTVTINVIDINDHAPQFEDDYSRTEILNTDNADQQILTVRASDADSGLNGRVTYDLSCEYPDEVSFRFQLGEATGILTVNETMGEIERDFNCDLTARDLGTPVDSTTESIVLAVVDTNNQQPEWEFPTATTPNIQVNNDTTTTALNPTIVDNKGAPIILSAFEETPDANADFSNIIYYLDDTNLQEVKDFFNIDRVEGYIQIKNGAEFGDFFDDDLDDEEKVVDIKVVAEDNPNSAINGGPVNSAGTRTLTLQLYTNFQPNYAASTFDVSFKEGPDPIDDPVGHAQTLLAATDPNNQDGQIVDEICYFVYDDIQAETFSVDRAPDHETAPKMILLKELDREQEPTLEVLVVATNLCDAVRPLPPLSQFDEGSRLMVQVEVEDIDDNPPEFVDDILYGGMSVDDGQQWSKSFKVTDPDDDFQIGRSFLIVDGSLTTSDPSLPTDQPFEVTEDTGDLVITANFAATNAMKGYFQFQVEASDQAGNTRLADAQIVIIASENKVSLLFNNPLQQVDESDPEIKAVFESVLPWTYTRDTLQDVTTDIPQTRVNCHFLDNDSIPVLNTKFLSEYTRYYTNITVGLSSALLVLDPLNGVDIGQTQTNVDGSTISTLSIIFIIATLVIGIMFAFLAVTYFIRVSTLERRVRALGADTFGGGRVIVGADNANGGVPFPGASAADNVPGTNLHAASGANPIWNIEGDMENPVSAPGQQVNPLFNKINDGDTTSNGSGDSVLIGVEDQAEFNQYRGHKDQIDLSEDSLSVDSDSDDPSRKPRGLEISSYLRPALDLDFPTGGGGGGGNPLYQSDEESV